MDIERIAPGGAGGPTGSGQSITTDNSTEPVEQRREKSGFNGRERYPFAAATQHAVGIKHGPLGTMAGGAGQDR